MRGTSANFEDSRVPARVWDKIQPCPMSGCWIWVGSTVATGYGSVWDGNRQTIAHRWMFCLLVGPIPKGLHIDHLCRVRCCVNPLHMEAVPPGVNVQRGNGAAARFARVTLCPRGHELTPAPAHWKRRKRLCLVCRKTHHREREKLRTRVRLVQ